MQSIAILSKSPDQKCSSCLQAANGCSAPRTSGLVMRPSAAATKVFSVPISWLEISWSHLMPQPLEVERILGASNTYHIGWRMQYFQSQSKDTQAHFWCFRHKPAITVFWHVPRLQIFLECLQLFTLVLHDSGWKSSSILDRWHHDSEFKVKHAMKTCGTARVPWMYKHYCHDNEFDEEPDDKDKLQRAGIWDQTKYKTKWAETPMSQCPPQTSKSRWEGCKIWQIRQTNRKNKAGYGTRLFLSWLTSVA